MELARPADRHADTSSRCARRHPSHGLKLKNPMTRPSSQTPARPLAARLAPQVLPDYDLQMPRRDHLEFATRAFWSRLTRPAKDHWQQTPAEFAAFRTFVRNQVLRYAPDYFAIAKLEVHPETLALLHQRTPILFCFIHHGFFPLIAFIVAHHFNTRCTTIGTAPTRNLSPRVNPDHLYWKYAFFHQAKRWLGTRFIFSDESPRVAIDWLKTQGSLTAAIDVIEDGVERKSRTVRIAGNTLAFPETVTRLARLSQRPLVASSLYHDGENVILKLGAPRHIPGKAAEDNAFQAVASDLFQPYLQYPEQRFFDLLTVFGKADPENH